MHFTTLFILGEILAEKKITWDCMKNLLQSLFFLQNEASHLTFLHLDFSNYEMDTRHAWKTFFKAFPFEMRRSLTIFYKVAPWMRRYNFQTFRNALEDEPNLNYADTSENEFCRCAVHLCISHIFFLISTNFLLTLTYLIQGQKFSN